MRTLLITKTILRCVVTPVTLVTVVSLLILALAGCRGRVDLDLKPATVPSGWAARIGPLGPDAGVQGPAGRAVRGPARRAVRASGRREPLRMGVWIPHWHRARGARRVRRHIRLFDSVSAFGFLIKEGGRIDDTLRHRPGDWRRLHAAARRRAVECLPTLVWARAADIHRLMISPAARRSHVAAIVDLAVKRGYRGVDLDYEGKVLATRAPFSRFLEDLSVALHRHGKVLSCTVEARTSDAPPKGRRAGAVFPWANDLAVMGRVCDRVRIMAYDQWFADHGATTWTGTTRQPQAPNADLAWVDQVVRHFARHVDATKVELGVPTYGWLFSATGQPGAWAYERISALSHTRLLRLVRRFGARTSRTPGGEVSLRYKRRGVRRVGTVCDALCVRDRIRLADRLGLRGVVLFKIEGEEDPRLWTLLDQERARARGRAGGQ